MPVRRRSHCEELSNGLTIRKDTASSGAMMAPTFSFIIPQSPATAIELCKRETRSNSKSSRDRKGPRPPMFRNRAVEHSRNHSAGRERPSAGHFFCGKRSARIALLFEPSLDCFLLEEPTGSLLVPTTNKHVLGGACASRTAVGKSQRRLQAIARVKGICHHLGTVTRIYEGGARES